MFILSAILYGTLLFFGFKKPNIKYVFKFTGKLLIKIFFTFTQQNNYF